MILRESERKKLYTPWDDPVHERDDPVHERDDPVHETIPTANELGQ